MWTVVGTWPTVGMIAPLLGVKVDVAVELAGHIAGTRGEVTVFTALFAEGRKFMSEQSVKLRYHY